MVQIELTPELEATISAQADAQGLALEQYIVERLEAEISRQRLIDNAIERIHLLRKGNIRGSASVKI